MWPVRVNQDRAFERLHSEGSQYFEVTIPDINATKKANIGFESNSDIRKYLPLNYLRIHNKGGTNLKIYVNSNPNGEIIIDDTYFTKRNEPIWNFTLENTSATDNVTGTDITCVVRRVPDQELIYG